MASGFAQPAQPISTRPVILQASALSERLRACFAELKDPRVERTRLHLLSDVVTIAILSVVAGGEGWEDMELYGTSKTETGHHRIDTRTVWTIPVQQFAALHQADEWVGLQTIVVVERTRRLWNKTTHEVQFYLSSLPHQSPQMATAIRQHWGIENSLHWVLDVTFNEDASRVRSLHAPHNLSLLRRFALNALHQVPGKRSLKQKSKRAAMDDTFMLQILAAALPNPGEDANPSCQ